MKVPRRTLTWIALAAGLVGLLAAAAYLTVRQQADLVVWIGLGLAVVGFVAAVALDRERWSRWARGRQARHGLNAALSVAAVVGILILVNLAAYRRPMSRDLSEDGRYSLAPETVDTLASLESDVHLIGFYSPDRTDARDAIRPLLQQYLEEGGGRVSYEFVDPRAEPYRAEAFGVTRDASVVVALGESSEVVPVPSEQDLTAAVLRLANPGDRRIYFLTGHGERDLQATDEFGYAQLRQALEAKNYTVEELNLLITPQVPEDALAVIVAGPTVSLSPEEIDALRAHVDRGGGLVALVDPSPDTGLPATEDVLAGYLESDWGVALDDDLIVDLASSLPLAAIAEAYAVHPITDRMQNLATYYRGARSLVFEGLAGAPLAGTELVLTGSNAWGETSLAGLSDESRIEFDPAGDLAAPLAVAAAVEDSQRAARLVVFGDSDFAANGDFFGLGNGDLLVNSIDWAADQEALISLTPKETIDRFVAAPSRQVLTLVALVSIVLVPAAFLGIGISTWWTRRSRG